MNENKTLTQVNVSKNLNNFVKEDNCSFCEYDFLSHLEDNQQDNHQEMHEENQEEIHEKFYEENQRVSWKKSMRTILRMTLKMSMRSFFQNAERRLI